MSGFHSSAVAVVFRLTERIEGIHPSFVGLQNRAGFLIASHQRERDRAKENLGRSSWVLDWLLETIAQKQVEDSAHVRAGSLDPPRRYVNHKPLCSRRWYQPLW